MNSELLGEKMSANQRRDKIDEHRSNEPRLLTKRLLDDYIYLHSQLHPLIDGSLWLFASFVALGLVGDH
jgi:hypothetical protein